jgi:hypothetical protein
MRDDVQRAVDIGLDQICLYHLVLFRGLGTAWSRDEKPCSPRCLTNEEGADNWLLLREFLLDRGYRQTSLTNFERSRTRRRPSSLPVRADQLRIQSAARCWDSARPGFLMRLPRDRALRAEDDEPGELGGVSAIPVQSPGADLESATFQYDQRDLELLHFTRRLAALRIDKAPFSDSFGALGVDAITKIGSPPLWRRELLD